MNSRLDALESRPTQGDASLTTDASSRIAELEAKTDVVITALHAFGQENARLRQQIDELLAEKMRTEGWLVSSGSATELALR